MTSRLPIPGADSNQWGDILNDFLLQSHAANGNLRSGTVGSGQIQDNSIPYSKLDSSVQVAIRQDLTGRSAGSSTIGKSLSVASTAVAARSTLDVVGRGDLGVSIKDYAVMGDAIRTTGSINAGSNNLTISSAAFLAADVGKSITIAGAGAAGAQLTAAIASFINSTTVTISAVAITSVPLAVINFGTNDSVNFQAAVDSLSAAGGGKLILPAGRYYIKRAIRCKSNVNICGSGSATVIYNDDSNSIINNRAAFLPGALHPCALYAANPAGNVLPAFAITDVADGSNIVTGSSSGAISSSSIAVGSFVGVRSIANIIILGYTEAPDILYWTKVIAKNGDALTLADPAPAAITGATLVLVDGSKTLYGVPDIALYIAENFSIENMDIDARAPIDIGGAYNFTMRQVNNRRTYGTFISCNALTHTLIENCNADWSYTWAELKNGSFDVEIRKCSGKWNLIGQTYHPLSFGEAARDIRIHSNRITVPSSYDDLTTNLVDFESCTSVKVYNNWFRVFGRLNSIFCVSGGGTALTAASDAVIRDNRVMSNVLVNRYLTIGSGSSPYSPTDIRYQDNIHKGAVATVDWGAIYQGLGVIIRDNSLPSTVGTISMPNPTLAKAVVDGQFYDSGTTTAFYYGRTAWMAGWVNLVSPSKIIGTLGLRSAISSIRIEINAAFNAGTTNSLTIGYSGSVAAYATTISVGTPGVYYIYPGQTYAGATLGSRESTAARQITAYYTQTGTAATAGKALITVYYEEGLPTTA